MTTSGSNTVVKHVMLDAPLDRAWAAIAESAEFGHWFGAEFDGPFVAGQATSGRIRPTEVDAQVAELQEPMRGTPMVLHVDVVEPMTRFAFRWNPEPGSDVLTRVSFELEPTSDGVALTMTEEGFDELPDEIRARRRADNAAGWEHQGRLLARYLERTE